MCLRCESVITGDTPISDVMDGDCLKMSLRDCAIDSFDCDVD